MKIATYILAAFAVVMLGVAGWQIYEHYGGWSGIRPVNDVPQNSTSTTSTASNPTTTSTTTTSTASPTTPTTTTTPTATTPKPSTPVVSNAPFTLPKGFSVSVFARGLVNPRVMLFDQNGVLLTSLTSRGRVVALPDKNNDGKSDSTITVVQGLSRPHGLALKCENSKCQLFVAETHQLVVFDYNPQTYKATNKKKLLTLSSGGGHSTRTLLLTKQNNEDVLLISVGSSCNVCREANQMRATVWSYNLTTRKNELFAKGLRNSVFMALHPDTGQIWATEMGRDHLGDNLPPEEINIIEKGKNYGWPICYGSNVHDTNFDKNTYVRNPCMEPFETPSFINMQAHSAPLGLAFVPSAGWPADYEKDLLVAFHGSWNRSVPTGFKIVRIKLDANGSYQGIEDFMTGFMKNGKRNGRPADISIRPNGTTYISDDYAGIIYRLTYRPS